MASFETATIDDAGTQLAFIDSGAPPAETYTTLIIVHGHTYHAQNFSRLLPFAKQHNLRVIALNRRDYVGSTPYCESELAIINSNNDDAFPAFLRARGLEIARFLVWVIREKNIPRASSSADGREGGLAVLGWSLGNLITMAFMRYLKSYPSEVVEAIRPYLRTFYIYECGAGTLGYPSPEGGYHPLNDSTIPPRMRGIVFGNWVSSYYKHPYYSSPSSSPSSDGKPDRTISSLHVHAPEREQVYRPSTLDSIPPADLMKCVDPVPPVRSEQPFMSTISRSIMYEQTLGVLLLDQAEAHHGDPKIQSDDAILPDVKIRVIYGDASIWSITWNTWELEKDLEKWRGEGRKVRDVRFLLVEGANHFLHWDDPELFLKTVKDGLV
ncbi:hypothetical protein ACEPAG_3699 [Sanghuangporus baumii]